MHQGTLEQRGYAIVRNGCPMKITVEQDDYVEILCGQPQGEHFEFVLYREALRALVDLGSEALQRMDAAATGRAPRDRYDHDAPGSAVRQQPKR